MRMRVLTQTNKGKLLAIADEVTKLIEADKATDVIMPAYPCDGERLIVIVATAKPSMPESFCRFVRSLKKSVTANVAFIIDGTPENAANIIEMANKDMIFGRKVTKSDFYFSGTNIGFETHGNIDCAIEVKNYNIVSCFKKK